MTIAVTAMHACMCGGWVRDRCSHSCACMRSATVPSLFGRCGRHQARPCRHPNFRCANNYAAFLAVLTQGVPAPSVWQPGVHHSPNWPPSQLQLNIWLQQQPREQKSRFPIALPAAPIPYTIHPRSLNTVEKIKTRRQTRGRIGY